MSYEQEIEMNQCEDEDEEDNDEISEEEEDEENWSGTGEDTKGEESFSELYEDVRGKFHKEKPRNYKTINLLGEATLNMFSEYITKQEVSECQNKEEKKEINNNHNKNKSITNVEAAIISDLRKEEPIINEVEKNFDQVHYPALEFKKKECVYSLSSLENKCECGLYKSEHYTEHCELYGGQTIGSWSVEKHIKEFTTDAFGVISFANGNTAKYIRVSSNTDIDDLWKFMILSWEMKDPKFFLSVIGSAKDYSFQPKLLIFRKNLVNAFGATGTWIITGGKHAGVMKYVGQAVSRYTMKVEHKPIFSIGIATWGSINNRKALVNNNGCWPAKYNCNKSEMSLDNNHSHFILVDSGVYRSGIDAPTIDLRNRLEKKIMQKIDNITGTYIPNVLILVEGTPDVLTSVLETIKNEAPVIVIGGSGQVADLLEFAYNNSEPLTVEIKDSKNKKTSEKVFSFCNDKFENKLLEKIEEIYPDYKEKDKTKVKEDLKDKVLNCIKLRDLITIFYIDDKADISMVILEALFKAKKISKVAQLMLAMNWNCANIAKTYLYPNSLKITELENFLFKAIEENITSFAMFLPISKMNLCNFLIPIKNATNKIELKGSRLFKLFDLKVFRDKVNLPEKPPIENMTDISNIITKQTSKYFEYSYCSSDGKLSDPAYLLFLWCMFMRHKEMALLFWQYCKHPFAAVLAAQYTSRYMYKRQPDSPMLKKNAKEYGQVAVDLLNKCYESKKDKTLEMLYQQLPEYNNSIFHMAVKADNKHFVGHAAYQDLLSEIWNGKLNEKNSKKKIFISLMIPFLAPFLIKSSKDLHKLDTANIIGSKLKGNFKKSAFKTSYFAKMQYFCSIPFATFYYNCVSHFALLILFAIILQTDFYPIDRREHPVISKKEIILIIWMITILMEEIRQVISIKAKTWQRKLYTYFDIWNILDMLSLSLFICGLILRFQPTSNCRRCFYSARIVLSFSLLGFFLRVLHMFSVNKVLGPKLVMMGRMIIDLFYFMLILMVVITSYGLTSQIIMYPNQEIDILLVRNIYSAAWWDIFGTLSIDEISGKSCNLNSTMLSAEVCASNYTATDDWSRCPSRKDQCPANSWVVLIMLAVYILIVNIMMINILIVIFGNTFNKVHTKSELVWKMQRYHLVLEYLLRPALPPPLIFISHISSIYEYFFKHDEKIVLKEIENNNWHNRLMKWKSEIAIEFYKASLKQNNLKARKNLKSPIDELRTKNEQDKLEIKSLLQKNEEQTRLLVKNLNLGYEGSSKLLNLEELIKEEKEKLEESKINKIVLIQKEYGMMPSSPPKSPSDNKSEDDVKKED